MVWCSDGGDWEEQGQEQEKEQEQEHGEAHAHERGLWARLRCGAVRATGWGGPPAVRSAAARRGAAVE